MMTHPTLDSTSPLHLCHLIAPGPMGGAEKVVLAGCEALQHEHVTLELAVIQESRAPECAEVFLAEAHQRGIPTHTLVTERRLDFRLYQTLRGYLRPRGFHVLHTHGFKALLYGARARLGDTALFHTHHGDTAHTLTVRAYEWLALQQMKKADHVCAVSPTMQESLLVQGLELAQVSLVPNMLSTPIPHTQKTSPLSTRGPDTTPSLVAIGRLSPEKGLTVLLEALATLPTPRPKLTIVGDGAQAKELKRIVKKRRLTEDVCFVGFQQDIRPFLAQADALVMPSFREGLPMTLIEATAWGLPVIATEVGGIPSLVKHNHNGLLCPPNDSDALRRHLSRFADAPEGFQEEAHKLAPSIRERFSPAHWAHTMLALYRLQRQS